MVRRKEISKLAGKIIDDTVNAAPWAFFPLPDGVMLRMGDEKKLEAFLKQQFDLWANSWVIPRAKRIQELVR